MHGIHSLAYLHKLLGRLHPVHLTDRDFVKLLGAVQRTCSEVKVESWKTLCEMECYANQKYRRRDSRCALGPSGGSQSCKSALS